MVVEDVGVQRLRVKGVEASDGTNQWRVGTASYRTFPDGPSSGNKSSASSLCRMPPGGL